jgi:hypothetical protein
MSSSKSTSSSQFSNPVYKEVTEAYQLPAEIHVIYHTVDVSLSYQLCNLIGRGNEERLAGIPSRGPMEL